MAADQHDGKAAILARDLIRWMVLNSKRLARAM
jgi:hypothetical protein